MSHRSTRASPLQRAAFEWSAILFAIVAVGSLGYWCVSKITPEADTQLELGGSGPHIVATDGWVTFCDHVGNLELIGYAVQSVPFYPQATKHYRWSLPGIRYDYLAFPAGGSPVWALRVSLLIPFVLNAPLAFLCFRRFLYVSRLNPDRHAGAGRT